MDIQQIKLKKKKKKNKIFKKKKKRKNTTIKKPKKKKKKKKKKNGLFYTKPFDSIQLKLLDYCPEVEELMAD